MIIVMIKWEEEEAKERPRALMRAMMLSPRFIASRMIIVEDYGVMLKRAQCRDFLDECSSK
jgi:hypothetical protein